MAPGPHDDVDGVAHRLAADEVGHDPADHPGEDPGEREVAGQAPPAREQPGHHHEPDAPERAELEQRLEEPLERVREVVDRLEDVVLELRRMVVVERGHATTTSVLTTSHSTSAGRRRYGSSDARGEAVPPERPHARRQVRRDAPRSMRCAARSAAAGVRRGVARRRRGACAQSGSGTPGRSR